MNDFQKLFWISILHRWYKFSCKRLSIFLSKWYKNVTLSILYLKVYIISTMPLKTSWPLSFPNIRIMRIGFYYIQHLDSSCVLECLRLRHPKWDTRVCIWFKSIIGLSKTEKITKKQHWLCDQFCFISRYQLWTMVITLQYSCEHSVAAAIIHLMWSQTRGIANYFIVTVHHVS